MGIAPLAAHATIDRVPFAAGDLEALDLLLNRDFALPDYNTALNQMLQRLR